MPIQFPSIISPSAGQPGLDPLAQILMKAGQQRQQAPLRQAQMEHEQAATSSLQRMLAPNIAAAKARAQASQSSSEASKTRALFTPQAALGQAKQVEQMRGQEAATRQQASLQQAMQVAKMKNETTLSAAQARSVATDPTAKAKAIRFDKDLGKINESASMATQTTIPLYTRLEAARLKVPTGTGPLAGKILWTTPQGQVFRALLNQAQGEFIKQFHLGRMTQVEFNLLKQAIGSKDMFGSALQKLFANKLTDANKSVKKLSFYHDYSSKGGKDPDEIAMRWNKLSAQPAQADKPAGKFANYSDNDWAFTAKKYGISVDALKKHAGAV